MANLIGPSKSQGVIQEFKKMSVHSTMFNLHLVFISKTFLHYCLDLHLTLDRGRHYYHLAKEENSETNLMSHVEPGVKRPWILCSIL